jgi:uncharacterized protein YhhL (DUF1145 family)
MSKTTLRVLFALKLGVSAYWVWVLRASLLEDPSTFDAIVALSAPMLLSLHFVQGLVFVQRLRGNGPWLGDFGQIMLFGVLHLWPTVVRRSRPSR